MKRHPLTIVVEALVQGHTIELNGYKVALDDDGEPAMEMHRQIDGGPIAPVWLRADWVTVGALHRYSTSLTDLELLSLGADVALTNHQRSKGKPRAVAGGVG